MRKTKKRFNPKIYKIKLYPEQAILSCGCYKNRKVIGVEGETSNGGVCDDVGRTVLSGFAVYNDNISIS